MSRTERVVSYGIAVVLGIVICQLIRDARYSGEVAKWKTSADSARAINAPLLERVASLEADSAAAHRREGVLDSLAGRWRSEAERLGVRNRELAALLPQVPAVAPDTCRPWVLRVAALEQLLGSTQREARGFQLADSASTLRADSAAADRDRVAGLAIILRDRLRVTDSLVGTAPLPRRTRVSMLLDVRGRSTVSAEAFGGLGVAYRGGVAYAGVSQTTDRGREVEVGWRRSLKLW